MGGVLAAFVTSWKRDPHEKCPPDYFSARFHSKLMVFCSATCFTIHTTLCPEQLRTTKTHVRVEKAQERRPAIQRFSGAGQELLPHRHSPPRKVVAVRVP